MGKHKQTMDMKNWITLASDVSWEDYHGMWTRKAPDGSWYVLKWTNMIDACGERDCKSGGIDQYECDVRRLDFAEMGKAEVDSALRSSGWEWKVIESAKGPVGAVVNEHDGEVVADGEHATYAMIEAMISYGHGAPLESFTSNVRPLDLRAKARRYAEELMKDADELAERLARPVNAIGSTAAEYGRGDTNAALFRDTPGTDPTTMGIMRKMHGIVKAPESTCEFGTLTPSGEMVNVRRIKHSDLGKCPFTIMVADHYREDGSCKCNDPEHRAMMCKSEAKGGWGYRKSQFKDIPLRETGDLFEQAVKALENAGLGDPEVAASMREDLKRRG